MTRWLTTVLVAFLSSSAPAATDTYGGNASRAMLSWAVRWFPVETSTEGCPPAGPMASFRLKSNRADARFRCSLDGLPFSPCNSELTLVNLPDGIHLLRAFAISADGIDSSPATCTWLVDSTAPTAPVVQQPSPREVVNTRNVCVAGTAEAEGQVRVFLNESLAGSTTVDAEGGWTFCLPTLLADGQYILHADVTDAAGNTSTAAEPIPFRVLWGPVETVLEGCPPAGPVASFRLKSNRVDAQFQCSLDGMPFSPCSSELTLANLSDGIHLLQALAITEDGIDASPATCSWLVDSTASAAPVMQQPSPGEVVNTSNVCIAGTAEAGGHVTERHLAGHEKTKGSGHR